MKEYLTISASLRRLRPAAPVVPPLLWATAAAAVLAGLNLAFHDEIWSSSAGDGSWLVLLGLLLLAGAQAVLVLWRWPPPPLAPAWGQRLWRVGMSALAFLLGGSLLLAAVGAGGVWLVSLADAPPEQV